MSHWQKGKISLNCSIDILRKALINIMPEWEKHIKVDPSKQLTANSSYQGPLSGYSLVIPQGENTGVRGADIGFKQEQDGTWSVSFDYVPYKWKGSNIAGTVALEVSKMRVREAANYYGLEITKEQLEKEEHVINVMVPVAFRDKKARSKQ